MAVRHQPCHASCRSARANRQPPSPTRGSSKLRETRTAVRRLWRTGSIAKRDVLHAAQTESIARRSVFHGGLQETSNLKRGIWRLRVAENIAYIFRQSARAHLESVRTCVASASHAAEAHVQAAGCPCRHHAHNRRHARITSLRRQSIQDSNHRSYMCLARTFQRLVQDGPPSAQRQITKYARRARKPADAQDNSGNRHARLKPGSKPAWQNNDTTR